jgi:signal transduction histidine kinase
LPVDLHITGMQGNIATLVDWSVYRIVQECLTNVMQHAGSAHTVVDIDFTPEAVVVKVTDDGLRAPQSPSRGGHGLAGMRERVEVMGGRLTAGARPGRGFEVVAEIPVAS